MQVLSASPVSDAAALAAVLLAAGTTYDNPKSKVLTNQAALVRNIWPQVESLLLKYAGKGKAKYVRLLHDWCTNPPKDKKDEDYLDLYYQAVDNLLTRQVADKVRKDPELSDAELRVAIAAMAWAKSGSATAYGLLRKFGAAVGMPKETLSLIAAESGSQEKAASALVLLLKKLKIQLDPKGPPLRLSIDQATELKASNPEAKAKYDALRKELIGVYKTELQNFVRMTGEPQPVETVRRHMQSRGILVTTLPEGFVGKIGDDGALYTEAGLKINGNTGTRVRMNPNYDPEQDNGYVFTYVPTEGAKAQTVYTVDWGHRKKAEKFEVTRELSGKLDTVLKKIKADLRSSDARKRVLSTMLMVQYVTAMRVGNTGNGTKSADGQKETTFGLSTLQVQHVRQLASGLKLVFTGKSGVSASYTLKPSDVVMKLVIENISDLLVDAEGQPKAKTDFVFEDKTGRYNAERVNKYLRAVSGIAKITNHKIRHMRGTSLASEIVREAPKKLDQKTAEAWFLKAMTKVGALLNHVKGVGAAQKITPATAIKNYIDPELSLGFFRERGLRIPKFLAPLERKA